MSELLRSQARRLAEKLIAGKLRVVFAESCTAGLVSASLAAIPGISEHHCGSAVTYRERTKTDWLSVSPEDLRQHTAVSEPVARQMAEGVLTKTVEADCSASVTGHLGPNAPPSQDGLVFIGVAWRRGHEFVTAVERHVLQRRERIERQEEAAALVLQSLAQAIERGVKEQAP